MSPLRKSSPRRSIRPEPQNAARRAPTDHVELKSAARIHADGLDGPVERRHAAGDEPALERRARGARGDKEAVTVPDEELGVRPDVHEPHETRFVEEACRQRARGGVGPDVTADERQPVHPGPRVHREPELRGLRRETRRGPCARSELRFHDRAVRPLTDRVNVDPEK
jgi:hypothetical protein